MKKLLLIGAIALSGASMVNAQKIGAKAGINVSSLGGDVQDAKSKVGFHLGVYADWAITDKFSIQPELLYSAEGAKAEYAESIDNVSFKYEEKANLDYLNIPIMFKYKATEKLYVEAGPQFGFLIGGKTKMTGTYTEGGVTETENLEIKSSESFKSLNLSLGLGAGYNITDKFNVGVRYMAGLSNIAKNEDSNDNYSVKSNVFSLSLGYRFK